MLKLSCIEYARHSEKKTITKQYTQVQYSYINRSEKKNSELDSNNQIVVYIYN